MANVEKITVSLPKDDVEWLRSVASDGGVSGTIATAVAEMRARASRRSEPRPASLLAGAADVIARHRSLFQALAK